MKNISTMILKTILDPKVDVPSNFVEKLDESTNFGSTNTKYVKIQYQNKEVLESFKYLDKIDEIVETIMNEIGVRPKKLNIKIILFEHVKDAEAHYTLVSGKKLKHSYRAFYSRSTKTIFLAVTNAQLKVIAHEITHAVLDASDATISSSEHERIARHVATHF